MQNVRAEYPQRLKLLADVTKALLQVAETADVPAMLNALGEHEALAPVVEPTAYLRGGGDNLADQRRFLEALQRFIDDINRMKPEETHG